MPLINNIEVVERFNRPEVEACVALKNFFLSDGIYRDPVAVSSVHVFKRTQNLSPNTVLDSNNLVASTMASNAVMAFTCTGTGKVRTDSGGVEYQFQESNYTAEIAPYDEGGIQCSGVSGVYRLDNGEFSVVLDGRLGGTLSGMDQNRETIQNTASAAVGYFDIWTVQLSEGGAWKTYINEFQLYQGSFISLTEKPILRARNKLFNTSITMGSKVNLKIGTEITLENNNISESIKNIFRESVVTNAVVEITKLNNDTSLPSRVVVVKGAPTSVTSNNTIIYNFDTDAILSSANADDLGSRVGTYQLEVTYNILDQKIVSSPLYFNVK